MNAYNKIKNPKTGRFVSINGRVGRRIIKEYYHFMMGGGQEEEITFTMYYAPWCGHCRNAKPEFEKLIDHADKHLINGKKIICKMVNCEAEENKDVAKKEDIHGYPTFKLKSSKRKEVYNGDRHRNAFIEYLEKIK
jgi:thiol-disulfide isomerase/thioredoxin